ncbi:MAG: hypothetical protein R2836_08940 [Chitinophagales bacterium]
MKKFLFSLFILTLCFKASAQNVGIGTATPDASAKLDVTATDKGFLPPRVNLTATNVATPITSPATGLLVYNQATAGTAPNNVTPGYYYWDGSKWTRLNLNSKVAPLYIRGTGLNNNSARVLRIGDTQIYSTASGRGLRLTIISKSTHAVLTDATYDSYGNVIDANNLATALNGINNGQIGILTSYDAWEGAVTSTLEAAFKRLGLYKALLTPTGSRRPYAAIFEGSSNSSVPSASAVEVEHSGDANQPYAEIRGWLIDGSFVATTQVPSGLATPVGEYAVGVDEAGNVGIGTDSPNASAILDISSTDKGVLLPKVSLSNTNTFGLSGTSNTEGVMLYNTNTTTTNGLGKGYYYWNGTAWSKMDVAGIVGDIKLGVQPADHNGWIKLDGRLISSLSTTQQAAWSSLGISGSNLPNATDKVLKQKSGSLFSSGGNNSVTIAQTNLPNVNFSGSTSTAGNHNHSFYTANHDTNSSSSQGYPAGNNHDAFRTTDRRQRTENNGTIQNAGNHSHTVTVNSGGSGSALNIENNYLNVNTFIYLGN